MMRTSDRSITTIGVCLRDNGFAQLERLFSPYNAAFALDDCHVNNVFHIYAQHDCLHTLIRLPQSTYRAIDSTSISCGGRRAVLSKSLEDLDGNRAILPYGKYFSLSANSVFAGRFTFVNWRKWSKRRWRDESVTLAQKLPHTSESCGRDSRPLAV
jgi:hypothetical protein